MFMMFDSSSYTTGAVGLGSKWSVGVISLSFISWNLFKLRSSLDLMMKEALVAIWAAMGRDSVKSFLPYSGVCFLLLSFNMTGLISFALSAQPSVSVSLALMMWFMGVLASISKSLKEWLSHFLPVGTPILLWPMIVALEFISSLIRPVTLSIRLTANILTGHVLLHFGTGALEGLASLISLITSLIGLPWLLAYEMFVCLLQAYIFTMLLFSYLDKDKESEPHD